MSYSILHIVGFNSLSVRSRLDLKFLRGQCMGVFAEAGSGRAKVSTPSEEHYIRLRKTRTKSWGGRRNATISQWTDGRKSYLLKNPSDRSVSETSTELTPSWQRRRTTPLFRDMLPVQVKPVAVKSCWHSMSQQVFTQTCGVHAAQSARCTKSHATSFKDFSLKVWSWDHQTSATMETKKQNRCILSCGLVGLSDPAVCLVTN